MSQTLSRLDAAKDASRESEASLDSNVPERQLTLNVVLRNLKSILARKDEEISHLTKNTLALEDALLKIERLEREIQKFHEQEISLKQKLDAKNKKIRAMTDAFKKAFEEATQSANSASSSDEEEDDDAPVLKEIPRGQGQVEQNLVCKKGTNKLHVNASLQGEMRNVMQVASGSADSPSNSELAEAVESAHESDVVADKSAVATSAGRRACATGEPEVETYAPPAKKSKASDFARPFQGAVSIENSHRYQARECDYHLSAAEFPRQEQVSVEREERQIHRSDEQTVQVQKSMVQKEKENENFIASNNEKNTINHEERPTSASTPGEPNASDVCEQLNVGNDSDDESDSSEENLADPDFSPSTGKNRMDEDDPQLCCECGSSYWSKGGLNIHKKWDCGKPKIDCKKCGMSYKPSTHQKHIARNDCISKDKLRCEYCHLVAQDGKKFKMHQRFCKQKKSNNETQSVQYK